MRPAFSIIFFTVMSGFGFGLAALVSLNLIEMPTLSAKLIVLGTILVFSGAGLISSTFHLGHPERAWRALTQWRSSWLSREGVLAIITLDAILGWFLYAHFVGTPPLWAGLVVCGLSLFTIFCTAMIYASLKTVARWHHPLTSVSYLAFGVASGLVGLAALTAFTTMPSAPLAMAASWALVGAWGVKLVWWQVAGKQAEQSTRETATGLGKLGKVAPLMPPHTSENYLQHEMGFQIGRKHASTLRMMALSIGGALPLILLSALPASPVALIIALMATLAGLFFERWLFFAEAKHVVMLYY
ncbi:MAG: dimethyl sulfoxide reductase anchor subunit family protein [Candidatus Puniceispirillaceae bacterium]